MVRFLLVLSILLFAISGKAQDENLYFSDALSMYLPKYDSKASKAYRTDNVERAEFLFDSLVKNCLKGSYFDNFVVRDLNKKQVRLEGFTKPLYLVTKASWLVPSEGEIPALNKLAAQYREQIDFVVLYWDNYGAAKEHSRKYHRSIKVLYVDELSNQSNYVIRNMKHALGFPTAFLLDAEKKIIDIRRNVSHPYGLAYERSYDLNHKAFSEAISLLLIHNSTEVSQTSAKEISQ